MSMYITSMRITKGHRDPRSRRVSPNHVPQIKANACMPVQQNYLSISLSVIRFTTGLYLRIYVHVAKWHIITVHLWS